MKWFRMYAAMVHDPKVQRLHPSLFKLWVNLLAIAADSEPRGVLPTVEEIAFALTMRPHRCQSGVTRLTELGLLDAKDGGLVPHNWDGRQYESDDVGARVKRYRERFRNVHVTPPDTDTDQRRSEGARSAPQKQNARSPRARGDSPLTAAACQDRFFEGTNPVAALVDMAVKVEGIERAHVDGGGLGGVIKKFGRGKDVWEALRAYTANRAVGPVHEYMMKVLANGKKQRGRATYGQAGGSYRAGEGRAGEGVDPLPILTEAEVKRFSAERRAEKQGVQGAGAERGDGGGQPIPGPVPGQEVAGDPAEQPGDDG